MPVLRKYGFTIAVLVLCAAMGLYLYLSSTKDAKVNLDQNLKVPNFQLTDMDGESVSLADSNGKVRVIYFFYANCPDICPPTTFLMTQLQDKLKDSGVYGKDVEFMSITFDPDRDTAENMRKFADKFDIDKSAWTFLRGNSEEETKKLMTDFGLGLVKDPATNLFTHTDTITFVDREGVVRKYMTGSIDENQNADKLAEVVDALVEE
ncbi:SCO family protein [Paenibacillus silvisoli]|uniref:SCO family protein n=1 Tax=Paenibacillus silvisoli TaxID=3110539 RepID=UPI002804E2F3|nr:SCO family protein [Paenibacillus silvisoli]